MKIVIKSLLNYLILVDFVSITLEEIKSIKRETNTFNNKMCLRSVLYNHHYL